MKKLFGSLLTIILLCSFSSFAEDTLTDMSYDELIALHQKIELELTTRPEHKSTLLVPGTYTVGQDISEGNYYVLFDQAYDPFMSATLIIYKDQDSFDKGFSAYSRSGALNQIDVLYRGNSAKLSVTNGNIVVVEDGSVKISKTDFSIEEKNLELPPDNAKEIPTGIYLIGTDFPAGRYNAYVTDKNTGEINIYADQTAYEKDKEILRIRMGLSKAEARSATFSVEEGQLLYIESGPVYMNKAEAITFD